MRSILVDSADLHASDGKKSVQAGKKSESESEFEISGILYIDKLLLRMIRPFSVFTKRLAFAVLKLASSWAFRSPPSLFDEFDEDDDQDVVHLWIILGMVKDRNFSFTLENKILIFVFLAGLLVQL